MKMYEDKPQKRKGGAEKLRDKRLKPTSGCSKNVLKLQKCLPPQVQTGPSTYSSSAEAAPSAGFREAHASVQQSYTEEGVAIQIDSEEEEEVRDVTQQGQIEEEVRIATVSQVRSSRNVG